MPTDDDDVDSNESLALRTPEKCNECTTRPFLVLIPWDQILVLDHHATQKIIHLGRSTILEVPSIIPCLLFSVDHDWKLY